jgi:beta-galactosidase
MSVALALKPITAVAATADQGSGRIRESFDLGWKFVRGDHADGQLRNLNDSSWQSIDLPHDWSIEGPFSEENKFEANLPTGVGWYRKRFRLAEGTQGRMVTIEFDGAYQNSEVWINEHYLGKRPYGYVPFAYDLTPYLDLHGENVIAVKVDNSRQTNSRWYSGSGIYRHTWLLSTDPLHIAHWGVFVTTPSVTSQRAVVQVKTTVMNEGKQLSPCALVASLLDDKGAVLQTVETSQMMPAGGAGEFVQQFSVATPRLWSHVAPELYTVRTTVRQGDRVIDQTETPFGIREVVWDPERGFILNGVQVKLNGVCLHCDGGCVGAAVPEPVWERRLRLLREMGCNAIRTSHNPPAAEFLDMCDRMGFLVMAEAFDEWKVAKYPYGPVHSYVEYFDEWYERDLENFVRRDRNHPSIVFWSAGNEIPDQAVPEGPETLRKLLTVFKREDPTRLVTAACDHMASDPPSGRTLVEFANELGIVGYNYVDRWGDRAEKFYDVDHLAHPNWCVVGTEIGAVSGARGDYSYLFPPDPTQDRDQRHSFTHNIDIESLFKFARTHDYVTGDFIWTGIDYLGESGWPDKASSAGVLDTCGFKKDGYYFYQSLWTSDPIIHLLPHWNWRGQEGRFIPVIAYTNCETVELFINGVSAGVKGYSFPHSGFIGNWGDYPIGSRGIRTTGDLHLTWDIPYAPGTLRAVGTRDGKVVVTTEMTTAGAASSIVLSADRNRMAADGRDVVHITAVIVDAAGNVVPDADNELTFDVQGSGKLIGLDSGNPASHEDYRSNKVKAFHGMCLALVRSTADKGRIKVTVTGPLLSASELAATGQLHPKQPIAEIEILTS